MKAVTVESLAKSYHTKKEEVKAVRQVSFEVDKGELFGIIGPDGAGKTTLFRLLTTLILPDSGSATVDGSHILKDFRLIRSKVGYMPGRFSLYPDLTVEENLQFFATIFQTTLQKNYELIKDIYIQIEPFKNRRAGKLSGGMKQKLALCCALIHRPKVLFLDEPTTGVDAVSRKEFWEMLQRLKDQGITILVSTPYMDEAALCGRVALMQEGRFLQEGTPADIIRSFQGMLLGVRAANMYPLLRDLQQFPGTAGSFSFGAEHHVTVGKDFETENLNKFLQQKGHSQIRIRQIEPGIEDCFLQLMQAPGKEIPSANHSTHQ